MNRIAASLEMQPPHTLRVLIIQESSGTTVHRSQCHSSRGDIRVRSCVNSGTRRRPTRRLFSRVGEPAAGRDSDVSVSRVP